MEKKKVLVAGGAGFIGSNLCRSLLGEYEVICVDDLSSGRKKNIEELCERNDFSYVRHNIIQPLEPIKKDLAGVDYVFHLASRASPVDYQSEPLHTLFTNSQGTYTLLGLARENKARFLFASTSEVYGDPLEHPQKETYRGNVNTLGIRACYDESKRIGETLTFIFLRDHKVDARLVRIFNTYGPMMKADDGRVVSNFINQALSGRDITVYGDGSQTRSFCYVSDMVEGIKRAMFSAGTRGEAINLGNPKEFTVLELAGLVKKLTGSGSKIIFKKLPEDDPYRRKPDISKAGKILKWKPAVPLEQGLGKTIEYFRAEQGKTGLKGI